MNAHEPHPKMRSWRHVLFHPDYTVGSGIAPDLLTLFPWKKKPLAGL